MSSIGPATSLADLASRGDPMRRALEGFGLDYCCGGQRTLAEACADAGLDPDLVRAALTSVPPTPEPHWHALPPADLADHLVATHHAYLHEELPRISALLTKVVSVHGDRHPELGEVATVYAALRADLEPHLLKEERVLFPLIHQLAAARAAGDPPPPRHGGSIAAPLSVMLTEHDRAGELLAQLRSLTGGYEPPDDACASYRALYQALAQLEQDTHLHVHKENNVLFPAVRALEPID